ncbi:MAG: ABC transporter substrate-binding protein [Chloroflexia bacterium]|nr:ABC transporter substrate-binding protein [Chloroflexia bacterium]
MRRLTRRRALQGVAGVAVAAALPGRGMARWQADAAEIPLVRFAWNDVGVPTPFQVSPAGPGGPVLLTLLYDTLTWKDEAGIIPWLASEWGVSEDGLAYTFRMVDGAAWHDGRLVTADDVAFSFGYYAQHPYRWMGSDVVETATVDGAGSVRIALKRPYAAFVEDIAGIVPIVPRHVWEPVADPTAYAGSDRYVGSGPFTLAEYDETGGAYRLVANDGYWRGRPRVREWRQVTVPAEAGLEALRNGEIDVIYSADASVAELLAGGGRLAVHETAPLSIVRLAVNTARAPLDRREVRQAIMFALDRGQIAETVTRGPAITGSAGVVPPETPWFNPALPDYGYDPERARALLRGETFTLDLVADASARDPDLLAPMLAEVGITLNVQRVDSATRIQLLDEGAFDLALQTHIGVGSDPDFLRRWYAGEEANAFAKGSIFDNPEFAALGEEQAATLDPERRRELVFGMQAILAEELPTIVLYHRRFYWMHDPAVVTPMETWGGLLNGVPFPDNKLTLL